MDKILKKNLYLYIIIFIVLNGQIFAADVNSSATNLSLGGNYSYYTNVYQIFSRNPALLLNIRDKYNFGLPGISVNANNNAVTISKYNQYNGSVLTDADKRDILDGIDEGNIKINSSNSGQVFGFSYKSVAFAVIPEGNMNLKENKDLLEMILFGNAINRRYNLVSKNPGGAWGDICFNLTFAKEFKTIPFISDYFDNFAAGFNLRYYHGIIYAGIKESTGKLLTELDKINGEFNLLARKSEGGVGSGLDMGVKFSYKDINFDFAVINMNAFIDWDKNNELLYKSYYISRGVDSLFLADSNMDSIFVELADTTVAISTFRQTLPYNINLGASYLLLKNHFISALFSYRSSTNEYPSETSLSLSHEYLKYEHFPLRYGLKFSSNEKINLNFGAGMRYKRYELNIGASLMGSPIFSNSYGFRLGLEQVLKF